MSFRSSNGKVVPLAYVLLNVKSTSNYNKIFNDLIITLLKINLNIHFIQLKSISEVIFNEFSRNKKIFTLFSLFSVYIS